MDNELLNKIQTDKDYGKGLIELPEGTAIPEGKVIYISFSDRRNGPGIMQSTVVYMISRVFERSEDGNYYYSFYLMNEGSEINEKYLVPESMLEIINRLVRNTCLAGCGNLKHDYEPGLISPINTESPIYNMCLELEDEGGQLINIPLSSFDIVSNGGRDILEALFTLLDSIRDEGTLIPKEPEPAKDSDAKSDSDEWVCACCGNTAHGVFCMECGAVRP